MKQMLSETKVSKADTKYITRTPPRPAIHTKLLSMQMLVDIEYHLIFYSLFTPFTFSSCSHQKHHPRHEQKLWRMTNFIRGVQATNNTPHCFNESK